MAIELWRLVFFQNEPAILSKWLNFLQSSEGPMVRCIQEDAWNMFLHLCETVGSDLSTYTEDDAWPSLFGKKIVIFGVDILCQPYYIGFVDVNIILIIMIYEFHITDDFVEFENDQANQNCHGKKFYLNEDTAIISQTFNETNDQLDVRITTRNISDIDENLAILSQSQINKNDTKCEQSQSFIERKSHDLNDRKT